MLDPYQLTLHTLTLRQLASAEQLSEITGQPQAEVEAGLQKAADDGAVVAARGNYMISPAGRALLDRVYPTVFAELRRRRDRRGDGPSRPANKQVPRSPLTGRPRRSAGAQRPRRRRIRRRHHRQARLRPREDRQGYALSPRRSAVDRFLDRVGTALTRAEGARRDCAAVRELAHHRPRCTSTAATGPAERGMTDGVLHRWLVVPDNPAAELSQTWWGAGEPRRIRRSARVPPARRHH
jgi:hypothetical protein